MKTIFFIILFFVPILNWAQYKPCITPEMNKWAEQQNPDAINAKMELEKFTTQYINMNYKEDNLIIIPVVFHVVHNYGSENISRAQVLDAIRILNEDYRKLNADTVDIIPAFKSIAADSRIEFRLAKIDPDGNCTDGIDRVVSSLTNSADEGTKMIAPSWDRTKYLNIWTVASIASGAAGYSYYPASVSGQWGAAVDGVLILASYIGSIGTGDYVTSRALTHEIGHYLNLMHTWGNSNSPGLPENCDDDDQVSDTPNTVGHTSCQLDAATCGSLVDNVQNYMEYAYCDRMFTLGQKDRMRATLNSAVSGRNNLWTTANLIATGVDASVTPEICMPVADFVYNKKFACTSLSVQYTDMTWQTDSISTYQWSFLGGSPSTSSMANPIISYTNAGIFSTSLTVTNPSGSSTITKNNIIQVQNTDSAYYLPWFEGFENQIFPNNPDSNYIWVTMGNANNNWQRTQATSFSGLACMKISNNLNLENQVAEIYSPNIFISGQDAANIIKFKVAYAQIDSNYKDQLQVFVSYNCGQSWYPRINKSGVSLQTVGGTYINNFIPTDTNQWRTENISIGSFLSKPFIRLKFVATSHLGNPIYIDNIQLNQSTSIQTNDFEQLYLPLISPNPITENSQLWIRTEKDEDLNIRVLDMLGKSVYQNTSQISEGEHAIPLSNLYSLPSGIYILHLSIHQNSTNIKIVIP